MSASDAVSIPKAAGNPARLSADEMLARASQPFAVRKLEFSDLQDALKRGLADFKAMPSHLIFLAAIYPICAALLGQLSIGYSLLPYFFPLLAGFAILGPFAALGLYEVSRRLEAGQTASWKQVLEVSHSPSRGAMLFVGCVLLAIFAAWMTTAHLLYGWVMGSWSPASVGDFMGTVLTTPSGWMLIILGHAIGFVFAALTFSISVVSFPMLLDRPVSAAEAIRASLMTVRTNPITMLVWAAIIAASLMAGSALLLVGLVVALPVIAHASWHLYRRAIEWRS